MGMAQTAINKYCTATMNMFKIFIWIWDKTNSWSLSYFKIKYSNYNKSNINKSNIWHEYQYFHVNLHMNIQISTKMYLAWISISSYESWIYKSAICQCKFQSIFFSLKALQWQLGTTIPSFKPQEPRVFVRKLFHF